MGWIYTRAMPRADGAGPPPRGFAWLVMGSGGRGESLIGADQVEITRCLHLIQAVAAKFMDRSYEVR